MSRRAATGSPVDRIAVDVGNSRVKWEGYTPTGSAWFVPIDGAGPEAWAAGIENLRLFQKPLHWAIAGSNPRVRDEFAAWARSRGDEVLVLDSYLQLDLDVHVQFPERVGMDRLMNAIAAKEHLSPGTPAVVIGAGTAVTVDWIDEAGAFAGGTIFPGFRLMAKALNDYTAKLPLVEVTRVGPPVPGQHTEAAIEAGVFWAVAGGVAAIARQYATRALVPPRLFVTGGDAALLAPPALSEGGGKLFHGPDLPRERCWYPMLTTRGIVLSATKLGFFG